MLKMFWDFEKSLKKGKNLGKFWLKLKKVNFSFLVSHFSPRNEKLEKNENENFSFSLQPIGQMELLDLARGKYKYVNVNTRQTNQKKKS